MIPCRIVDTLTSCLPWRFARDAIRLRHGEACPLCGKRLASKAEAGSLIRTGEGVGDGKEFWSGVKRRIEHSGGARPAPLRPRLSPASNWAALAGAAALVAAGFLIIRGGAPRTALSRTGEPVRFEIGSLKVDGKSVTPVVIQPEGSDLVIVWAGIDR